MLFKAPSFEKPFDEKEYNADVVIKNATILTLNENSEIIRNGWIAIKEGIITALGNGKSDYIAREVIEAKGKVAMPGLINTHTHAAMTLFRGIDDDSGLSDWLDNMRRYENKITRDDVYWGALLGEIEMIKSGTTTFNDMYFYEESVLNSVSATGIRSVIDIPFYFDNNGELIIDEDFINKSKSRSTVNLSIAPNPLVNFSIGELKEINKKLEEYSIVLHVHIEEDTEEKSRFIRKHNLTPIELLARSGLFKRKVVLAHAVNLTDNEIEFISKHKNVGISFNAKSNFKLLGSTARVAEMLDNNLAVGIGTDGAASSNSLDMFDQMNFIAFAAGKCNSEKKYCKDKRNIYPEKIVRMATIDGAKVLGMEKEIGSIEIGKKADIILIDFRKASLIPSYNIYSTLVYSVDGSDVADSIINGRIVMKNRELIYIDEKKVIEKVKQIAKGLAD